MSHADKTILVSGATGRQGGALLKYLLGDGWRIRALTRNPRGRTGQELSKSGVEVVQGDMDDVESLKLVDDTGHLVHRCSCGLAESDVLFQGDRTEVITMFDLEANKAIALRLVEDVFNSRRLDLLEDVLHPEFRGRGFSAFPPEGPEVGPGARRKLYETFYQAIPDARAEVLDVVAEGDKVVLVDRFGGTHRGELFGRPGTGDRIEWMAIHIYTIRDGKVLEDAVMTDALAIMQQLGLTRKAWPATEQAQKY